MDSTGEGRTSVFPLTGSGLSGLTVRSGGALHENGVAAVCERGESDGFPAVVAFLVPGGHCGGGTLLVLGGFEAGQRDDEVLPAGYFKGPGGDVARSWDAGLRLMGFGS
jgi:hypothetical protein